MWGCLGPCGHPPHGSAAVAAGSAGGENKIEMKRNPKAENAHHTYRQKFGRLLTVLPDTPEVS